MDISNIVFLLNHFVYIVYNGNVIFSFIKKNFIICLTNWW